MFAEFDNIFIWAQLVGLFGILISALAWQSKSPRKIIFLTNFVHLIWAFHFYLLNAPVAVAMNITGLIKNIFILRVKEIHLKYIIIFYIVFTAGLAIFLWENSYSIFPILACISFNISLLFRNNRAIVARGQLIAETFWLPYSIHAGSIMSASCGIIITGAVLYGMYRHEKWDLKRSPINLFKLLFSIPPISSKEVAHV